MKLIIKYLLLMFYSVVLAEFFLRIFNPIPILPRYVSATEYGIRGNTPNASYEHITPEYKVNVDINSKGIRANKEIEYTKLKEVTRIVTLGDSFMLGYGANYAQTFLAKMTSSLPEKSNIEIINLGVSGHGTAEELITLREEGSKYSPDIVLLSWHGTDYSDNVRSGLFDIQDGEVVQINDTYLPAVKIREYLFSLKLYELIATNSQLYSWLREFVAEIAKNLYTTLRSALTSEQAVQEDSEEKELEKKYKKNNLAVNLLLEINKEVNGMGAKFIILDIPRHSSNTNTFWSTFPEDDRLSGILVYNPIKAFNNNKDKMLYWERSDGHFTPLGNKIVGDGLADFLLTNKYF